MNASPNQMRYALGPFIILTFLFFIVGLLTTINGQFQGPLQNAFLSLADKLRNTLTTLISFFFFLGYLINSGLGGRWVDSRGYKPTLVRALLIMTLGLLIFSLSAWLGGRYPGLGLNLGDDYVPWAYFVFLLGSFLLGSSAAIMQVAMNPYVASYALPGTSAVQRMNIATGVNSIGTTIGPFFVTGIIFAGLPLNAIHPSQLMVPILCIAGLVFLTMAVTRKLYLPDLAATRSTERLPRSVWSFSHLALGVASIFLYVGGEVSIGVNINLHAIQMIKNGADLTFLGSKSVTFWGINFGIPALLATLYWGGMMVGRLASTAFPKVSPRALLAWATLIAAALVLLAMLQDNLYILAAVGLCHSVMWGCIFTLAIAGLGPYTSRASGVFMMGVFGGAVLPLVQGILADYLGSWRWTWIIVLICELAMFFYALWGSQVRDAEAKANIIVPPVDPVS